MCLPRIRGQAHRLLHRSPTTERCRTVDEANSVKLTGADVRLVCEKLTQEGWGSARLALGMLEGTQISSVKASLVRRATIAGVYRLRRDALADSVQQTFDLDRFVEEMSERSEDFVLLLSVHLPSYRFVCVLSAEESRPIGSTAVKGAGGDPFTHAVGEIGQLSFQEAKLRCQNLMAGGWESAAIALQGLTEAEPETVPIWLASPKTLAREYSQRAQEYMELNRHGQSLDMNRFAQKMQTIQETTVCIFHIIDAYGWQCTGALTEDLAQPIASVAVKR